MSTTKKDQGLIPKTEGLRKDVAELGSEQTRFRDAVERPTHIETVTDATSTVSTSATPTLVGAVIKVNVPPATELKVSFDGTLTMTPIGSGFARYCRVDLCDVSDGKATVIRSVQAQCYFAADSAFRFPISLRATVKKKPNSIARFQVRLTNSFTSVSSALEANQYWEVEFKTARTGRSD